MDIYLLAVFLGVGAFILYLTVPLLPSILIYKIFPKTQVAVSGPLSGLTINAGGAFAAYLIIVLLAYSPVKKIYEMIGDLTHPTWTVKGRLILKDKNNGEIHDPASLLQAVHIMVEPDLVQKAHQDIEINLPHLEKDRLHAITINIPEFGQTTINLNDPDRSVVKDVKRDDFRKIIVFEQIPIEEISKPQAPYRPPGSLSVPDPSGPPAQPL